MGPDLVKFSRFLSLVLRHQPETIGIKLDEQGWIDLELLIRQMCYHGHDCDRELIEQIIANNTKQRFAISADGQSIRARQGHSVAVDLGLVSQSPPATLYHGTAQRYIPAILRSGLKKMTRQHVHLSVNLEVAKQVGGRHGKPVILIIHALKMFQSGFHFYLSENGVWLTEHVPIHFFNEIAE